MTQLEAHSKKIYMMVMVLVVGFTILLSSVSAAEWDNIKTFDKNKGTYGEITIRNALGLGSRLASYTLEENRDSVINAQASGTATLYYDSPLFSNLGFEDLSQSSKSLEHKVYYNISEEYEEKEATFKETCKSYNDNSTKSKTKCYQEENGTVVKTKNREGWIEYHGENLSAGTYKWRIEAKKPEPNYKIDWIVSAQGKDLTEWAWWNNTFGYRKTVNITGGVGTLPNFTALLNVTYSANMQADFDDIRFVENACNNTQTNELKYEMDAYIPSNSAIVWVKVPTLNAGANQICMYYSNNQVSSGTDTINAWDANYSAVWHMNGLMDSKQAHNLTNNGNVVFNRTGIIANGSNAYAGNDYLIAADSPDWDAGNITMELFFILHGGTSKPLITQTQDDSNRNQYSVESNGGTVTPRWSGVNAASEVTVFTTASTSIVYNQSYYTYFSKNSSGGEAVSINASYVGLGVQGTVQLAAQLDIGKLNRDDFRTWTGTLDEIRISKTNRSSSWLNRSYDNSNFTTFAFQAEEQLMGVIVTQLNLSNLFNTTSTSLNFSCNQTTSGSSNLANTSLIIYNSSNGLEVYNTKSITGKNNLTNWTNFNFTHDDNYKWACTAGGDDATFDYAGNRTFLIDTTNPRVSILAPLNNSQVSSNNQLFTPVQFNASASDANALFNCWYFNETENVSITCNNNATITLTNGNHTLVYYANDTLGHVFGNSTTFTINYSALEVSLSYTNSTTEGASENFGILINASPNLQVSSGNLIYVNVSYPGVITVLPNNVYAINRTLSIPDVTAKMGREFWWNVTMSDNSLFNSSMANLTVSALSLDDCSVGSIRILNFTLKDEDNENVLNNNTENLTAEVNILINSNNIPYSAITTSPFVNFNQTFANKSQILICLASSLGSASFRMDSQVKYGGTRYAVEYSNLQNYSLSNSTLSQNISLLNLLTSRATPAPFKITFKDQNFLPVVGALTTVTRKYVGQGVFKTVESPISDSQGTAIASLVQNEIIYTFIFTKDGQILGTFSNQQVKCSNPVINDCEISFSSAISGIQPEDFTAYKNLSYAVTQNAIGNTFTLTFTTTDSATKNIQFNATKVDNYGNQSLCSPYLSSSTGTLICTIPSTFSNVSVITRVYSNGELIASKQYYYAPNTQDIWGLSGYLMLLIMILTIPLMLSGSPIGLIIGVVLGLIIGVSMVLFNVSGVVGIGTSVMWAIVAGAIIIWKINNTGNG